MKFISAQLLPPGDRSTLDFDIPSMRVNRDLDFKILWAIPITTFKETLLSMLLTAPNYPECLFVFDSDEFVRIDKVKYYQQINDLSKGVISYDDFHLPIADESLSDIYTEYCLDRSFLSSSHNSIDCISSIMNTSNFLKESYELGSFDLSLFFMISNINYPLQFEQSWVDVFRDMFMKFPSNRISIDLIEQQYKDIGASDVAFRSNMVFNWYRYKFVVLPVLLYALCKDTALNDDSDSMFINLPSISTCISQINEFISLDLDMGIWSKTDCSYEGYTKILNKGLSLIPDDPNILDRLFDGNPIKRNELCPCGSNKKYKKCHGG